MTKAEKTRIWYQKNKERKKEYNQNYYLKSKMKIIFKDEYTKEIS